MLKWVGFKSAAVYGRHLAETETDFTNAITMDAIDPTKEIAILDEQKKERKERIAASLVNPFFDIKTLAPAIELLPAPPLVSKEVVDKFLEILSKIHPPLNPQQMSLPDHIKGYGFFYAARFAFADRLVAVLEQDPYNYRVGAEHTSALNAYKAGEKESLATVAESWKRGHGPFPANSPKEEQARSAMTVAFVGKGLSPLIIDTFRAWSRGAYIGQETYNEAVAKMRAGLEGYEELANEQERRLCQAIIELADKKNENKKKEQEKRGAKKAEVFPFLSKLFPKKESPPIPDWESIASAVNFTDDLVVFARKREFDLSLKPF